jgi:hypothetical protein
MNRHAQVLPQLAEVPVGLVISHVDTFRVGHEDVNAGVDRGDCSGQTTEAGASAKYVYSIVPFDSNSFLNCQLA